MKRLVNVTSNPFIPKMSSVVETTRYTSPTNDEEWSVIVNEGKILKVPTRYVHPSRSLVRQHVRVIDAPGYGEFAAIRLEEVGSVDSRGPLSIVKDWADEFHVIASKHLRFTGVAALDSDDPEAGE